MAENKKKKDFGSPIGITIGFIVFLLGVALQPSKAGFSTNIGLFWSLNSLMLVIGSTIASAFVAIPASGIKTIPGVLSIIIRDLNFNYLGVIDQILGYATIGRKDGLFALEKEAHKIEDPFFANYLEQATFERDQNKLKSAMELELNNISARHEAGANLFTFMGTYAPAFGMMGTVMGLIIMMNGFTATEGDVNVADKFGELLGGMATALITTFYGVLFANLMFLPIAAKLERRSENEIRHKQIVVEGILMIHAGEHPILIKEKLMNFVPKEVKTQKGVKNEDSD
ncbi:MAG: hypothetical protein CMG55_01755 [Candidatus Marinimicrobia bacterium]|nr:hypothetical protein [Candidatus Neomarinimicrobiota bacterium]|tara:strand:+ start:11951 stop:12805 length:855 start_codon:yes stop_codon:yes gene_type:complete